ncbi:MAG: hypothetical protein VW875_05440 [Planctomycetaceae bacterium]
MALTGSGKYGIKQEAINRFTEDTPFANPLLTIVRSVGLKLNKPTNSTDVLSGLAR